MRKPLTLACTMTWNSRKTAPITIAIRMTVRRAPTTAQRLNLLRRIRHHLFVSSWQSGSVSGTLSSFPVTPETPDPIRLLSPGEPVTSPVLCDLIESCARRSARKRIMSLVSSRVTGSVTPPARRPPVRLPLPAYNSSSIHSRSFTSLPGYTSSITPSAFATALASS